MTIVTRTGDLGMTGLVGGKRISKADPRIAAIGAVDELNALIGCVRSEPVPADVQAALETVQHRLFTLGADLASPSETLAKTKRIAPAHVAVLDAWIARMEPTLPPLAQFILPSGNRGGALLHHARTVCRRAERGVALLKEESEINPQTLVYLNRLSDLLFVAARATNVAGGLAEEAVKYEDDVQST